MDDPRHSCDILVVGAGPAGLAAACRAARGGKRVTIVDDNPSPGGQIWRRDQRKPNGNPSLAWFREARRSGVELIYGANIFDQPEPGLVLGETREGVREIAYGQLILATGARERLLPFPGWTLPNVCGAGGLQALVKSGLSIEGKRVVVAGSGPLLLAVAAYLRKLGAHIPLIAEQTPWKRLFRFGLRMLGSPAKAAQAAGLRARLAWVPYLTDCWVTGAAGDEKLETVELRQGSRILNVECDYLACGFHLVPNVELAAFLGCELAAGGVRIDEFQETSMAGIYSAGETTGIGGLELSLVEGEIAGYAAAGLRHEAASKFRSRQKLRKFSELLNNTFALRDELRNSPRPDTIVCRCEDVTIERLRKQSGWRAAKLHTRCGMGPCQGRVCGPAIEFLLGWRFDSVRPPVFPVRLASLAQIAELGQSSSQSP
jgi:NADPH-dependent 2,4-dienoyl-CoA reductase/sulfur reductase-like enzyme